MVYPILGHIQDQRRRRKRGASSYSVVLPLAKADIPFKRYIVGDGEVSFASEAASRVDGWERVWREVNSSGVKKGQGGGGGGSRGEEKEEGEVEDGSLGVGADGWGCAVLDPGNGGSSSRLWVFGNAPLEDIHGLQEEERSSGTLEITKSFQCATHGHEYSCLRPGARCIVSWNMDNVVGWEVFGCALAEREAWRTGRRVVTRPAPGGAGVKQECRVWPVSSEKLVLVVTPQPMEGGALPHKYQPTRSPAAHADLTAVTIHPLAIPALHIAAFSPTSSEQQALESSFAKVLGSAWMASTEGHGLDVELGRAGPEWGVYWVPFSSKGQSAACPPASGADLASGQGVMVLWPTLLVANGTPGATAYSPPQSATALPALGFPTPASMMDVAVGLFDFMSTYDVPMDVAEATPESQPPPTEPATGEAAPSKQKSKSASPARSENSDLDDLFEDRSGEGSPSKAPEDAVETGTEVNNGEPEGGVEDSVELDNFGAFNLPELVELDTDIVMSSPGADPFDLPLAEKDPQPRGGEGLPLRTVLEEEEQDQAFVTEDDFNFFDSPGEEDMQPAPPDNVRVEKPVVPIPEIITSAPIVDEVAISPARSAVGLEAPVFISVEGDADLVDLDHATAAMPTPPPEHPLPLPTLQIFNVDDGQAVPLDSTSPASKPLSPETPLLNLVPSPFSPLPNITSASSFPYSLPTPATTPESLRPDLVDRLKSKEKYDYAAQWDIESVDESMDEDEEYTGAPPTPISFIDSETLPSRIPTPKIDGTDGVRDRDIRWEGVPLVGVDLIKIQWDPKALVGLARGWSDSWIRGRSKGMQSSKEVEEDKEEKAPEGIEVGRLVEEVISSRFMRELVVGDVGSDSMAAVGKTVVDLDLDLESKVLPQVTIHAGLSSHIAQLSIASLRYWRQLGLQPSGGRKDLTAYCVCEVGEGITRAVSLFISHVAETYEGCLLGTHAIGQAGASRDGVVSVPPAGFVDSITGLISSSTDDTVIYVVLPEMPSGPFSQLIADLLSSKIAESPTSFIKLVPLSALDTRDAQSIVFEVYERLSRPVRPIMLRGMPMEPLAKHAQYPAFTLSTPARPPKLSLIWPLDSYDVLNRCRTIHCAFDADFDLGRAVAFVMDPQGEGWKSKVIAFDKKASSIAVLVIELLIFYLEFARKSAVDFRLAVCFPAPVPRLFLKAWKITMNSSPYASSIIIVDGPKVSRPGSKPRLPVVPVPPSTYADPASKAVDESLMGHWAVLPRIPIPAVTLTSMEREAPRRTQEPKGVKDKEDGNDPTEDDKDGKDPTADTDHKEDGGDVGDTDELHTYPLASFSLTMPTPSLSGSETTIFHILHLRSLPSSASSFEIENQEEFYAGEYHRLACLGRTRFGLNGGVAHVEAARLGLRALRVVGGGEVTPSASAAAMAAALAAGGALGNGASAGGTGPGAGGVGEADGAAGASVGVAA